MKTLDEIGKEEIKEYLGKGWLTHDGMWFYNVYKEFGIDLADIARAETKKEMSTQ